MGLDSYSAKKEGVIDIIEDIKDLIYRGKNGWVYGEELTNWMRNNSGQYYSVEEMSKSIGLSTYLVGKLKKEYNFEFKLTKYDPKFKAIYQDYNWCYEQYMVKGLNHNEMALEANCSKRVIEKWCTEKHRITQIFRKENKPLSDIQKDLIIGSMLGDGHIDKRETQPLFIVSHAKNQKDYLYYKYKILKDFCNIPPTKKIGELQTFCGGDKEFLSQDSYRISTRIQDCFIPYREMSIIELLNNLNSFSFSIWMLDDGCRQESNWDLCIARFNHKEKDYAIKTLKEKFNINTRLKKDDRYLFFPAVDSRKIDEIIKENIPNELDIMQYKIIDNKEISNPQKRAYILNNGSYILLSDYCKENNLNYKSTWGKYKDELKVVTNE